MSSRTLTPRTTRKVETPSGSSRFLEPWLYREPPLAASQIERFASPDLRRRKRQVEPGLHFTDGAANTVVTIAVRMYDSLKSRIAELLRRPRAMKPQTERQLTPFLAEHSSSGVPAFLLCAADVLEEFELDVVFGPLFTPTLEERAELADLLFHWTPTSEQLEQLVKELSTEVPHATVNLPDGSEAKLSLHEVMVDRFVRLLRLDAGPDPATAAALRDALPSELWPVAMALACERGMTVHHQHWFAAFVNHIVSHRRDVTRELLQTIAEFIAGQKTLDRAAVLASAEALAKATRATAAYAGSGHAYWSPDVAQHHHYRGEGKVDQQRLDEQQAEASRVAALLEELKSFEFTTR